jgi:hypothetical protein
MLDFLYILLNSCFYFKKIKSKDFDKISYLKSGRLKPVYFYFYAIKKRPIERLSKWTPRLRLHDWKCSRRASI